MEGIENITDQLLIQTAEMAVKINMLTSMVMGVYSETLPKEAYLNIATSFFDRLYSEMEAAYVKMEVNGILSNSSSILRNKMDCLLTIAESKRQWCGEN